MQIGKLYGLGLLGCAAMLSSCKSADTLYKDAMERQVALSNELADAARMYGGNTQFEQVGPLSIIDNGYQVNFLSQKDKDEYVEARVAWDALKTKVQVDTDRELTQIATDYLNTKAALTRNYNLELLHPTYRTVSTYEENMKANDTHYQLMHNDALKRGKYRYNWVERQTAMDVKRRLKQCKATRNKIN